ncbi:MAG: hypothetical protein ACRDU5_05605 [Mycobacterium sp.]
MTVSISHPVLHTVEAGSTQPTTLSALLRELGVSHSCVEKHKVALRGWLCVNMPHKPLRISLLENGYGLLLKETDEARAATRS